MHGRIHRGRPDTVEDPRQAFSSYIIWDIRCPSGPSLFFSPLDVKKTLLQLIITFFYFPTGLAVTFFTVLIALFLKYIFISFYISIPFDQPTNLR